MLTYTTAQAIAKLVSSIGWMVFFVGIIGLLFVFVSFSAPNEMAAFVGVFGFVPAATRVLFGLFLISLGQLIRAAVDTADFNGEMLADRLS